MVEEPEAGGPSDLPDGHALKDRGLFSSIGPFGRRGGHLVQEDDQEQGHQDDDDAEAGEHAAPAEMLFELENDLRRNRSDEGGLHAEDRQGLAAIAGEKDADDLGVAHSRGAEETKGGEAKIELDQGGGRQG